MLIFFLKRKATDSAPWKTDLLCSKKVQSLNMYKVKFGQHITQCYISPTSLLWLQGAGTLQKQERKGDGAVGDGLQLSKVAGACVGTKRALPGSISWHCLLLLSSEVPDLQAVHAAPSAWQNWPYQQAHDQDTAGLQSILVTRGTQPRDKLGLPHNLFEPSLGE